MIIVIVRRMAPANWKPLFSVYVPTTRSKIAATIREIVLDVICFKFMLSLLLTIKLMNV